MTIEEFKILLKDNGRIRFSSSDYDLLRKLEKILLSNGYRWGSQNDSKSIIDRYFIYDGTFCLSITKSNILEYSYTINYEDVQLTEEVIKTIENYFTPISNYKPRKIIKEL